MMLYNLANLSYLSRPEKCYQHLVLSLSLYGNKYRRVKRQNVNGKSFIFVYYYSTSKKEENSLQYYLGGRDAENEFIELIHKDKLLMQGADEICD